MLRKYTIPLSLSIALLTGCGTASIPVAKDAGIVSIYPFAQEIDKFEDMSLRVRDAKGTHDVELYSVSTNPKRQYPVEPRLFKNAAVAMFDMSGAVTLEVTYPTGISSVVVRPARAAIEHTVKGNTVFFQIKEWGQYTVEFNDDPETNALLIFANPPAVIPENARVIEGYHREHLVIAEGETVYMAPGSVLRGKVIMRDNSKLMGRGIILKSGPPSLQVWYCDNVTIEGVAVFEPSNWVLELRDSSNISIENIKIVSSRNNGDGITIQSSNDIKINKSFVRTWDDNVVLKNYTERSCFNIAVTNCVMWTDLAQTLEIGFETNKGAPGQGGRSPSANPDPRINDIIFENIDILHNFHKAPISIHNADGCRVYNIIFRNVILENAQMGVPGNFGEGGGWPYLIDFGNGSSAQMGGAPDWTHNDGYREIKDVLVENVWVLGGELSSCGARFVNINSGDYESVMENIQLRNIYFKQEPIDYTDEIEAGAVTGMVIQENAVYFHWDDLP